MVHVTDLLNDPAFAPSPREIYEKENIRTVISMPLMRENTLVGVITTWRREARPFTDKQIALLKTFADQAVIAIENVRLFRELGEKNALLETASKHKSQFLANVSHELRTPLNSIIGFTRIVLRRSEGKIEQLQKENLQKVLISSEHLLSLINELLDLAKIEAGRMDVYSENFKLEEVLRIATATVEPMLRNGNVKLVTEMPPDLPPLKSDRDKLKQIVLNLLSNSAKFTEKGEIKVAAVARRRHAPADGLRHRHRHESGSLEIHLRGVPPGRHVDDEKIRRHRPGPGHRQTPRPLLGGDITVDQRRRQRLAVHGDDPDGAEDAGVRGKSVRRE